MSLSCAGVCQGWIKHATLINNCYPTGPGETLPKSSELSYLVFYANSKPAKLTKCGVYLEKRVATDVRKRRKQDTEVSLQIIKVLIDECKKDLNLFSKNVVKIIAASLSTNDIDLVSRATSVFITFCAYHNGSTLGVDTEFTSIYESLIDQFAKYATCKYGDQNLDQNLERRYRSIGLYALQGAATSSALYASDAKTQLQYIIPAILHNLTEDKTGLEALQKNVNNPADSSTPKSRRFSASIAMISTEDNTLLAYHCLEQLFTMSNASNLRYNLEPTFTILDENKFWWPSSFGITLILVILSSIQQQYRHILVGDIIQRLESSENSDLSKKITFIEMLTSILTSDLTLVGLSVLEVLDCLLSHLLNSLKNDDVKFEQIDVDLNLKTDNTLTEKAQDLDTIFIQRLIICIGSLATHIYYANQISDIVERIVQHLKLQVSTESQQGSNSSSSYMTEGIPLSLLRKALLKCLSMVVRTNKEAEKKSSGNARSEVPVEIFHNSIDLCTDEDLGVRIAYAQVLSTFLNNVNTSEDSKEIEPIQITYFNQPAIHFLNTLHLTLYKYTLLNDSKPGDNLALLVILRSLLIRFRADQIVRGIPVVFKLQSEAKDEKLDGFSRQRALASLIVLYFSDIAQVLDIPELQQYIEKERIEKCQWSTYFKTTSSENNLDNVDLSSTFEDEITNENNQPLQPVDIWLDRQIIVPMLCKHKEIENIGGAKLEEKLMAEWRQEEGFEKVKKEAYKIRSSRILETEKPRLVVTPYIMSLENSSDDLTPKVKADNFKETLAVQLMNDSSEHETSVASDRESSNMVPIHIGKKKRKNSTKNEASAFLSAIEARAASTTSLVNPPYQF
ncbi:9368_t:CDS:10 [Funneliformis mosseae]|uniref:9368_t:CDS:1 n=1 Tax=Funneliformis mosseae TaxID=27381 RepID=A0A9N9BGY7_FUNMO|nr:9368_t:CDS:10 [Funneliformis mosseae]